MLDPKSEAQLALVERQERQRTPWPEPVALASREQWADWCDHYDAHRRDNRGHVSSARLASAATFPGIDLPGDGVVWGRPRR